MTLNRKIAPASTVVDRFQITEGTKTELSGVPVYQIFSPESDVLKIDFYYQAGVRHQTANGLANACVSLLPEGTSNKSSEEIALLLDNQGAYLTTQSTRDEACMTLYCLPRFLNDCVPVITDVLCNANYTDNEIDIYKENSIQSLLVNKEKTSYLARKKYNEVLFGSSSAYGTSVNQADIENISRGTLLDFYGKTYRNKPAYVMVAGNITSESLSCIERILSCLGPTSDLIENPFSTNLEQVKRVWVEKNDAVQSSIRIGKTLFNRAHSDYREMTVVNMILGGYFGSRLMKNLREEKGLTYGIYSAIDPMIKSGTFTIGVELNSKEVDLGIQEIYKELNLLATVPVSPDELTTVKNYYLGSFLRGFDGPFSLANYYKTLIDYNLDYSYYYGYIDVINNITPERIMQLAAVHLQPESMVEVVAGKKQ